MGGTCVGSGGVWTCPHMECRSQGGGLAHAYKHACTCHLMLSPVQAPASHAPAKAVHMHPPTHTHPPDMRLLVPNTEPRPMRLRANTTATPRARASSQISAMSAAGCGEGEAGLSCYAAGGQAGR